MNPCTPFRNETDGCVGNCCYAIGPANTGDQAALGGPFSRWFGCGDKLSWIEDIHHPEGGVTQRYSGGTDTNLCAIPAVDVEMNINFVCDPDAGLGAPTTAKDFVEQARKCKYNFLWKTDQVCVSSRPARN